MANEIIYFSNVRLSFPHIAEPQKQVNAQTGKERISYNCELLMPLDHPGLAQLMRQYAEMAALKWAEHANTVMAMIQQDRKLRCFGKGDEKLNKKTFKPYDGYAGNAFVTVGKDTPPQIIQADGSPIDPTNTMAYQQITRKMYGGCRVNAAVKPWLQANAYGNGIRCDLVALQFAGDDVAFGEGTADASGMFGQVSAAAAAPSFMQPAMPAAPFGAPTGLPSFFG